MHEQVGIYINPVAQKRYQHEAVALPDRLNKTTAVHELLFPLHSIPDREKTVIVFGGDGSVKGVMEALLKRDDPGTLLIVPAGAQNGLYAALLDVRTTVSLEQLQDKAIDHIPYYNPGNIGGELFNHVADLTKAGVLQLKYTEALRGHMPGQLRAFVGAACGFVAITRDEEYPEYAFKILMTSPFMGAHKIVPEQGVYDNTLTLLSMKVKNKAEGAARMAALFLHIIRQTTPPQSLVEFSRQESFTLSVQTPEINVDGELRSIPQKGDIFIARDVRSLRVAAFPLQ